MLKSTTLIWQKLGPGILFAAAAVGVSHLVQATRAGADYGLGLTLIIIFACLIKYPSLRFGGDYAAATGKSLITSYRKRGWWAFGIYAVAQLFSMVFIVAAVTLFTLGLLKAALGFEINNLLGCTLVLAVISGLLLTGKYHLLEKLTKYVVVILTLLIVAATLIVIPRMDWSIGNFAIPSITPEMILYLVALVGFMPTPPDGSVFTSLWTCARAEEEGKSLNPADTALDFNVGYIASVVLALCFLILGAGVIYGSGVAVERSNGGFAEQLIQLFTSTVGQWSFPLIATAALFVMFSTLLTVVDGMTRIGVEILSESRAEPLSAQIKAKAYSTTIPVLCIAAIAVLAGVTKSFTTFLDITSIMVFIISPLIAYLNHRAVTSEEVAEELRPGPILRYWSLGGVFLLTLLTLIYFYSRLA